MNTNFLHNILNVLFILIPALHLFDWSAFFDPATALQIVAVLGFVKLIINALRDGPAGMIAPQPPVRKQ